MIWECDNCKFGMTEYACFGHRSEVDNGCPKCGNTLIWFFSWGYKEYPAVKTLIDISTEKVIKRCEWK